MDLDNDEIQKNIKSFSARAFQIIKKSNSKIRSIIIQYHSGKIFIGNQSRGGFHAVYYDSSKTENEEEINTFVDENASAIIDVWDEIHVKYPKSKAKSFNIFYNQNTVLISKNRIGSIGAQRCRFFNAF